MFQITDWCFSWILIVFKKLYMKYHVKASTRAMEGDPYRTGRDTSRGTATQSKYVKPCQLVLLPSKPGWAGSGSSRKSGRLERASVRQRSQELERAGERMHWWQWERQDRKEKLWDWNTLLQLWVIVKICLCLSFKFSYMEGRSSLQSA